MHSARTSRRYPPHLKAYEPWSTILVTDPIAIPLIPLLVRLKITANMVSIASTVVGVAAGAAFAAGYWIWGAVLFEVAFLGDCIDGKIARYCHTSSPMGVKLDYLADTSRLLACFAGIAVHYYLTGQLLFAVLTLIALVAHFGIHRVYVMLHISLFDLESPVFIRTVIRRIMPRFLAMFTFFDEHFLQLFVFPLVGGIIGGPAGEAMFLWGTVVISSLELVKATISLSYRWAGKYDQIHQPWSETKGNLDKAPAAEPVIIGKTEVGS